METSLDNLAKLWLKTKTQVNLRKKLVSKAKRDGIKLPLKIPCPSSRKYTVFYKELPDSNNTESDPGQGIKGMFIRSCLGIQTFLSQRSGFATRNNFV